MTSASDRKQLLCRELRDVQEASIDDFVAWWSLHMTDRTSVTFERDGLRLVARERGTPVSEVQAAYDLETTEPHWRARLEHLVARLSSAGVSLPVLETGPVFGLETNAWPHPVGDAGYLVLVNQGWIQLGYWIAQVLAVTDAGETDESAARADRILRSLPRVATDLFFDDSLELDNWLPDPLPPDAFDVETPEVQSYVAQGEAFILLHELAHILHGDLDRLKVLLDGDPSGAEVAAFRRRCELEADRLGTTLLVTASPSNHVDEWALGLLFWLVHTADEYGVLRSSDPAERSHPPATERLRTVLDALSATQTLQWDPEQLVELARSVEPVELELEPRAEHDLGPSRIRRLRLRFEDIDDG